MLHTKENLYTPRIQKNPETEILKQLGNELSENRNNKPWNIWKESIKTYTDTDKEYSVSLWREIEKLLFKLIQK